MLSEEHGIISCRIDAENSIAVVRIEIPPGKVKLPLGLTEVAIVRGIPVRSEGRSEEICRGVLDGIKARAIRLGSIQLPPQGTMQHVLHNLPVIRLVGLQERAGNSVIRANPT